MWIIFKKINDIKRCEIRNIIVQFGINLLLNIKIHLSVYSQSDIFMSINLRNYFEEVHVKYFSICINEL